MKDSLSHLPSVKQEEITAALSIIRKAADIEMLILFGSYARGDWVEDSYVQEHVLYEYTSDLDLLAIVKDEKRENNHKLWHQIRDQVARDKSIITPVSLIVESIDSFNEQLGAGRYFYVDILREGVLLYTSKKFELTEPRTLSVSERTKLAEEDQKLWMSKAEENLKTFAFHLEKDMHNLAAFDLHQACESYMICFMLISIGYRPKTHDLEKLLSSIVRIDPRFAQVFPRQTEEDERLFSLLKSAYVDARYSKSYRIQDDELRAVHAQVQALGNVVETASAEIIDRLQSQ